MAVQSVFAGEPVDLTEPGVLWAGDFRPVEEIPPPVRHAAGYGAFVAFLSEVSADPSALAADTRLLVVHLRQHLQALRAAGDDLLDSAGIFLGNSLIARVEDGCWQHWPSGELEVTQGDGGVEVLQMIRAIIDADDERMREFDDFLRVWDDTASTLRARAAAEAAAERRLELVQPARVPETRFEAPVNASLVDLLRALIVYLTTQYEATVHHRAALGDDPSTISPTVETIEVRPASADGAPLLIAIDDVGAIALRAGAFNEFFFYGPDAAQLESTLLAVAAGLYRETCLPGPDSLGGHRLGAVDRPGSSSARRPLVLDPDELTAIIERLDGVPNGWAHWPLRAGPAR